MTTLTDTQVRDAALAAFSWQMVNTSSQAVLDYLNSPGGATAPGVLFDRTAREITQQQGPDTAMKWAASLSARREDVQRSVLNNWLQSRPEAARGAPEGKFRKQLVSVATSQLSWQSYETARKWITSVPAADRPAALAGLKERGPALTAEHRTALEGMLSH